MAEFDRKMYERFVADMGDVIPDLPDADRMEEIWNEYGGDGVNSTGSIMREIVDAADNRLGDAFVKTIDILKTVYGDRVGGYVIFKSIGVSIIHMMQGYAETLDDEDREAFWRMVELVKREEGDE